MSKNKLSIVEQETAAGTNNPAVTGGAHHPQNDPAMPMTTLTDAIGKAARDAANINVPLMHAATAPAASPSPEAKPSPESLEIPARQLRNRGEWLEKYYIARFGVLPDDHPVTQYLHALNARFPKTDVRIRVLPHMEAINVFALPNNVILISGGLINFCQYEEELQFVLGHERTHLNKGHHFSKNEDPLENLGAHRFQEYEADLRSVIEEMNDNNINPYGGKYFLQRLHDESDDKDLAHGGSFDRMINIGVVTRLFDLKELSMDLTPWNAPALSGDFFDREYDVIKKPSSQEKPASFISAGLRRLKKADDRDVVMLGANIQENGDDGIISAGHKLDGGYRKDLIAIFDAKAKSLFKKTFPKAKGKEAAFLYGLFMHYTANAGFFRPETDHCEQGREEFFNALETREDFDLLAKLHAAETFKKLDIPITGRPLEFMEHLLVQACDMELFGNGPEFDRAAYLDFCGAWLERTEKLLREYGVEPAEAHDKKFGTIVYEAAAPSISADENTTVLAQLKAEIAALWASAEKSAEKIEFSGDERRKMEHLARHVRELADHRRHRIKIPGPLPGFKTEAEWHQYEAEEWTRLDEIDRKGEKKAGEMARELAGYFSSGKEFMRFAEKILRNIDTLAIEYSLIDDTGIKTPYGEALIPSEVWNSIDVLFIQTIRTLMPEESLAFPLDELFGCFLKRPSIGTGFRSFKEAELTHQLLEHIRKSFMDPAYSKDYWGVEISLDEQNRKYFMVYFLKDYFIPFLAGLTEKRDVLAAMKDHEDLIFGVDFSHERTDDPGMDFLKIFTSHEFSLESADDARALLALSRLFKDPIRAKRLQAVILDRLASQMTFYGQLHLLFNDPRTRSQGELQLRDQWIEKKEHAPVQLDEIEAVVLGQIEEFTGNKERKAGLGGLAITDIISEQSALWQKQALLELLMQTESDKELFKYLFLRQRDMYMDQDADAAFVTAEETNLLWGMNDETRYALLRMLLIGKNGIFRSKPGRKKFLESFLKNSVQKTPGQENISALFDELVPALAAVENPELFYFVFSPLIFERFAHPPRHRCTPKEMLEELGSDAATSEDDEKSSLSSLIELHEIIDGKYLGESSSPAEQKMLSPLSCIIQVAKGLGAPGVRFAQVIGQYLDIPEEYAAEFAEIYDQMRGQSKIAAHKLLRREWPDYKNQVKLLRPRIGGGSLMTVYEAELASGEREVIKVMNPNVGFHLEVTFDFIQNVLQALVRNNPEKYKPALMALRDIREWIERDLDITGFLADDKEFAQKYHQWRIPGGANPYQIGIPRTKGPENRFFIREEFVEGLNLTQWDALVAEGHDMKQIVSLLCKQYLTQIGDGQVHADVHVGNIRIAQNKTCYLLDRGSFYLKFEEGDKALFSAFFASDRELFVKTAAQYFADTNPEIANETLHAVIDNAARDCGSPKDLILDLKNNKIKVPLKITLLMKNLGVLDSLSRKAGFANFQEALAA